MLTLLINLFILGCGVVLLVFSFSFSEKHIQQSLSNWAMDSFIIGPILGWAGKKMNIKSPYRKALIILGIFIISISIFNLISAG
ncbi:hypothetical protein EFP23_06350 [Lacticaseibacillus paracasei]|jgi:hypothetical protein|nr:hypothetical protein AYR55_11955 [Loigolactobacillus backii]MCT3344224.1 hypothetical protein [Lacticaseibacillus paracasei]OJF73090.1 hypothetical protein BOQ55_13400 [Lacticaseibacillus casei]OLF69704.1 hypothetical protein ACX53_06570 [Loigolactobacillus backii]PIO88613.1 hypothetical protein B8A32_01090 [Loigolactobacillus backii]